MGIVDKTNRIVKDGAFYSVKPDGSVSDEGIVDDMLNNEDEVRKDLISNGIINKIVLDRNEREIPYGVFYCTDKTGATTDRGIVDEMLSDVVRADLLSNGVIKQFYVEDIPEDEVP